MQRSVGSPSTSPFALIRPPSTRSSSRKWRRSGATPYYRFNRKLSWSVGSLRNATVIAVIFICFGLNFIKFRRQTRDGIHTLQSRKNSNLQSKPVSIKNPVQESSSVANRICSLEEGPTPVVLMVSGRSGSAVTYKALTNLTGLSGVEFPEYTGGDPDQTARFWEQHTTEDWVPEVMCQKQKEYPNAGVVGIKWKPYRIDFVQSPGAVEGLRWIAKTKNKERHPLVKLVRIRRNALDVLISQYKHTIRGDDMLNHCTTKDCQQQNIKASSNLVLPTEDLMAKLFEWSGMEDNVDQLLDELQVPHFYTSYEKLYYGDYLSEWKRLFAFIGKGPTNDKDLTQEKLHAAMAILPTNNPQHNVTLANYVDVRDLLTGTEFEHLLH